MVVNTYLCTSLIKYFKTTKYFKAFTLSKYYKRFVVPFIVGRVGIVINGNYQYPKNPNDPADWNAGDRGMQFESGWFMHPVFANGDYPSAMKEMIGQKSREAGLNVSRLPVSQNRRNKWSKVRFYLDLPEILFY